MLIETQIHMKMKNYNNVLILRNPHISIHSDHYCFDRLQLKLNKSKIAEYFQPSSFPPFTHPAVDSRASGNDILEKAFNAISTAKNGQNFIRNDHLSSKINQFDIDARFQN